MITRYLFALLFLLPFSSELLACKCNSKAGFWDSEFVYEGKIAEKRYFLLTKESMTQLDDFAAAAKIRPQIGSLVVVRFTLENIRVFKGKVQDRMYLYTTLTSANCGLGRYFEVNDEIIVYAKSSFVLINHPYYIDLKYPDSIETTWSHTCTETQISSSQEIKKLKRFSKKLN